MPPGILVKDFDMDGLSFFAGFVIAVVFMTGILCSLLEVLDYDDDDRDW